MLFYELCDEYQIDSEQGRTELLSYMASQGLMDSVSTTARTKQQLVEDYKKHFNVLDMTNEDDNENTSLPN